MEKRFSERVYSDITVDFYYDHGIYEATAKNLSRNGLFIDTDTFPPYESHIVVSLNLGDNFFTLPGKVKRSVYTNELSGIGVELLNPSQSYFKFVSNIIDNYMGYVFRTRIKERINRMLTLIKKLFPD